MNVEERTRRCTRCGTVRPLSRYRFRPEGPLHEICIPCQKYLTGAEDLAPTAVARPTRTQQWRAFQAGQRAGYSGQTRCPYAEGDGRRAYWFAGTRSPIPSPIKQILHRVLGVTT